jgi:hypothetical protein
MNQEIIALLRNPKNFETGERISEAVEKIKDEPKLKFLVRIQEDLKNRLRQVNLDENWHALHTPQTGTYGGVSIFWRGRRENLWQFSVLCETQDPTWNKVKIGIYRGANVQEDKQVESDKKVRMLSERDALKIQKTGWWIGCFNLRDLLGWGTKGIKALTSESLVGEHRISEQAAKRLWEIFERHRMELEDLNRNYPYVSLAAPTRTDALTDTTA